MEEIASQSDKRCSRTIMVGPMSSKSTFKPKSYRTCRFCKRTFHANTKYRLEAYMAFHTVEECEAAKKVAETACIEREKLRPMMLQAEAGKHAMPRGKVVSEFEAMHLKSYSVVLPGSTVTMSKEDDIKRAEEFLARVVEGSESADILISRKEWLGTTEDLERAQKALRALTTQLKGKEVSA